MLTAALLNQPDLAILIHDAIKKSELFVDEDAIPEGELKKLYLPIYEILREYLLRCYLENARSYLPSVDLDDLDKLTEIRLRKYQLVEAQKYEEASKLRDQELKLRERCEWISDINQYLKLLAHITRAEFLFCAYSHYLDHFKDLYLNTLYKYQKHLLQLCTENLLIELYYHFGGLDKTVYEYHLRKWDLKRNDFTQYLNI
jgi:hypothetical protein